MSRRPTSCRRCGAETSPDAIVSWGGLCPKCGEVTMVMAEYDLSDITSEPYWNAARRTREALRRKMDDDLYATLAAYPDIVSTPDLDAG